MPDRDHGSLRPPTLALQLSSIHKAAGTHVQRSVNMERHLDAASVLTIIVTVVLFGMALVAKGLTHDVLLEAAVFLVSVKLILAGYKSSLSAGTLLNRLARIETSLARLEQMVAHGGPPPPAEHH